MSCSGWVMLGKPLPDPVKSYTALGFQGHLSKVQIWGRALDVTNEIQKQVSKHFSSLQKYSIIQEIVNKTTLFR